MINDELFLCTKIPPATQTIDFDGSYSFPQKTAAIQDSFEYRFGLRRNARLNPGKYENNL